MYTLLSVTVDRLGKQQSYMFINEVGQSLHLPYDNIPSLKDKEFTNAKYIGGKFPYLIWDRTSKVQVITNPITYLYHGSDGIRDKLSFRLGRKSNDYGDGFYTTQYKNSADEWAFLMNGKHAYRNEYSLDLTGMRILDLDTEGPLAWIAEVMYHRRDASIDADAVTDFCSKYRVNSANYDIIQGYRADDSYFAIIKAFTEGLLSVDETVAFFYKASLGKQVFLKSRRAIAKTQFIKAVKANERVRSRAINNDNNARQIVLSEISKRRKLITYGKYKVGGG